MVNMLLTYVKLNGRSNLSVSTRQSKGACTAVGKEEKVKESGQVMTEYEIQLLALEAANFLHTGPF